MEITFFPDYPDFLENKREKEEKEEIFPESGNLTKDKKSGTFS